MRIAWIIVAVPFLALAEPTVTKSPITAEQLAHELKINGGNWKFEFDEPVYAVVALEITKLKNASGFESKMQEPSQVIKFAFLKRSEELMGEEDKLSLSAYLNNSYSQYVFKNPIDGLNVRDAPSQFKNIEMDTDYFFINAVAIDDESRFIRLKIRFSTKKPAKE